MMVHIYSPVAASFYCSLTSTHYEQTCCVRTCCVYATDHFGRPFETSYLTVSKRKMPEVHFNRIILLIDLLLNIDWNFFRHFAHRQMSAEHIVACAIASHTPSTRKYLSESVIVLSKVSSNPTFERSTVEKVGIIKYDPPMMTPEYTILESVLELWDTEKRETDFLYGKPSAAE